MLRSVIPDERESFDAYHYLAHLGRHARFLLIVCASAALIALIASLLLPKQYTATALITIDPPAGSDPRSSTVVNPVYFESLRAYELLAASDSLFRQAVEKFHLRESPRAGLESLKRDILKVTKVRDTRILEISVTLPDPRLAHDVAGFIAGETVNLTRDSNLDTDRDLLAAARKTVEEAQRDVERRETEWREFSKREPMGSIKAEVAALAASRDRLERDLVDSRAELAEFSDVPGDPRAALARARVTSLEQQSVALSRDLSQKAAALSERQARSDELDQRLKAAEKAFDAAAAHLRDVEVTQGTRGERLRVIDPGVVPERPSRPNVALNVLLALAAALIASVAYLTLTFRSA